MVGVTRINVYTSHSPCCAGGTVFRQSGRDPTPLVHDGIDRRIDLFGPCDRGLQHLFGADLALGDEPGEGDGVVLAIFFEPHGLQISN
jgi:hypothetical protein